MSERDRQITSSPRRWALAAVAALVAVAPIVAGVLLTSSTVRAHVNSGLAFTPDPGSTPKPAPTKNNGALVAIVKHTTTIRWHPEARR